MKAMIEHAPFLFSTLQFLLTNVKQKEVCNEPLPVKRTVKKYKVFPASSHELLAAFYAARQIACFSIGVRTPRLR